MNFPIEKNKNIIILGDIMLDRFYFGQLEDTSKEDPLAKVLKVENSTDNLGGAGNVAVNIKSMLSNPFLLGVVGDDQAGQRVIASCQGQKMSIDGIFVDESRSTTVKSRLYDGDQVIRFDEEVTTDISQELEFEVKEYTKQLINTSNIDGIILQDYNKGFLTKSLINEIISLANKYAIPIYVDPKRENFFEYKHVTIFKPNEREINWSLPNIGYELASIEILKRLNPKFAVITLADKGMHISSDAESLLSPASTQNVIDVCGAGDTVITILALTHLSKCNMKEMSLLANLAAANVCQLRGVKPIEYAVVEDLYHSLYKDKDIIDIA